METTNLSKIRRDKMLMTINEIKKNISDEETLTNLSMIENELTKKKYGLIWEEHEERVDKELETQIPTFEELKDKEIISIIAIITCIIITFFCLIGFKRINFLENTDWLKNILFSISVAMICLLVLNVGKYKLKSKEIETELKVHKLYADSFDNLVDSIRSKQHEFDNHINTIYSQHYIYNTYMESYDYRISSV